MATIINNQDPPPYPDMSSAGWVFYDTNATNVLVNNLIPTSDFTMPTVTDPWTANISSDQASDNFYTGAEVNGRYDFDEGLLVIPVAGPPGTPPVIVRVYSPYAIRSVDWSADRVGARPQLPGSQLGAQEVLLSQSVLPMTPAMIANGQTINKTTGRYVYALTVTPGPTDQLANARGQYDGAIASAYNIRSSDFVSGIIAAGNYTGN